MKAYVGGSFRNEDTLVRSSDIGSFVRELA